MACYVYGRRIADDHLWEDHDLAEQRHEFGEGPLCIRCGLPIGTWQSESADDVHQVRTGHHLGSGACLEQCGEAYDWTPDLAVALGAA